MITLNGILFVLAFTSLYSKQYYSNEIVMKEDYPNIRYLLVQWYRWWNFWCDQTLRYCCGHMIVKQNIKYHKNQIFLFSYGFRVG